MKIEFDSEGEAVYDGSAGSDNYIEVRKNNDSVEIILSSRDPENIKSRIINSVVITTDDFKKLISDID